VHPLLCAAKHFPKTWPKPRVSIKAPALFQTRLIKTDQLLSNAQRAPEGFSSWQGIEAIAAGARCGDVGSRACSINFSSAAALDRGTFDSVINRIQ
jgi:hypothetical protein